MWVPKISQTGDRTFRALLRRNSLVDENAVCHQVYRIGSLLIIKNNLRDSSATADSSRRTTGEFVQFNLRTDLLDLRRLLFHSRSERRNFLLKLLHGAMLFKEFI